jgi:UDP-glucose 4-epimerase
MTIFEGSIPQRVLVTGGSGLLGSHVVDLLLSAGVEEVAVFDRFVNRLNLSSAFASGRVTSIESDNRDLPELESAATGCDMVIHLAALLMKTARQDPQDAFEVNMSGTHCLKKRIQPLGRRLATHR